MHVGTFACVCHVMDWRTIKDVGHFSQIVQEKKARNNCLKQRVPNSFPLVPISLKKAKDQYFFLALYGYHFEGMRIKSSESPEVIKDFIAALSISVIFGVLDMSCSYSRIFQDVQNIGGSLSYLVIQK